MEPNTQETDRSLPMSQPNQNVQSAPKSSSKKWIAIVILLVILLIVVTSGAFLLGRNTSKQSSSTQTIEATTAVSPTPASIPNTSITPTNPTPSSAVINQDNWRYYRGYYVLKYPPDWTTIEADGALTIYPSNYPFKAPGTPYPSNPYLRIAGVKAVGRGVEPIKQNTISINGIETTKYYETDTSGILKAVQLPNGYFLNITFKLPNDQNKNDIDKTYDQILNTIKF